MAGSEASATSERGWLYHPDFAAGWEPTALYPLARWVNGIAFRDIQFSARGWPVIKIAEIKGGISGQTKFTEQSFDDSVYIQPGDLLFSWSGQPETSIDAFWWRGPAGWLNQHVFKVTPEKETDIVFFYYLLRYLKPNFIGIARNKQTTGLGHVTRRDLENIVVSVPVLSEQRAIAHILGALDDRIEANRWMAGTLEAMARALFRAWFVTFDPVRAKAEGRWLSGQTLPGLPASLYDAFPDRLVETGHGEIPEGWWWASLPEIMQINPARSLKSGADAPYLDMAGVPTAGHRPEGVARRPFGSGMKYQNGDTLVARITPCLENGKTAFVDFLADDEIGWGSTEFIVLSPRDPWPKVTGYLLARDERFREFAIQSMTGTSGRQRVPASALGHFLFPYPGDEVLKAFGKMAESWISGSSSAIAQNEALGALRDALLPKLVSGALRVKDAETFLKARGL